MIDLAQVRGPLPGPSPSGENLEDDRLFDQVIEKAKGKAEILAADKVIEAVEPKWDEVLKEALLLCERTRDLRIAVVLVQALAGLDRFPGLAQGLGLLVAWLDTLWDSIHPGLEASESDPAGRRADTIANLRSPDFLRRIRSIPLADSRQGPVTLRDLLIAQGVIPPDPNKPKREMAELDTIFSRSAPSDLEKTYAAIQESSASIDGVAAAFRKRGGDPPELDALRKVLGQIGKELGTRLGKPSPAPAETAGPTPGEPPARAAAPGAILSTADVVLMLDKICEYYEKQEPSSPVPLLLRRARRLVSKKFVEIIKDLSPESLKQIETISGPME